MIIKNRWTGETIGEWGSVEEAVAAGANLRGADLSDANLSRVDLRDANLSGANLSRANLSDEVPEVGALAEMVANLDRDGEAIVMERWHTCETAHCLAGWAVHLAGQDGADLESKLGPAAAGAFIWFKSEGVVPNFYGTDEAAREWLSGHVVEKQAAAGEAQ